MDFRQEVGVSLIKALEKHMNKRNLGDLPPADRIPAS
jgi:hypothetical protein